MNEWISVTDRLPLLGAFVLFCGVKAPVLVTCAGAYIGNNKFMCQTNSQTVTNVTHWMYFPEMPA